MKFDLEKAAKQKCKDCQHYEFGKGMMGTCSLIDAPRHQRFWCNEWLAALTEEEWLKKMAMEKKMKKQHERKMRDYHAAESKVKK